MGLEFGTGGLRGIMGEGEDQMNNGTVQKATQGLANYIIEQKGKERGVAIAYDTRNRSFEFAQTAACCLAANNIKAWIFPQPRPTPMLSYAIRELGCMAGIVVTASHNPPDYNGYKVYWEDGGQITAPRDKEIIARVNDVADFAGIKTISRETAEERGLYQTMPSEIEERYFATLKRLALRPEIIREQAAKLRIVYTPLHGTGNLPVRRIFQELGFAQVFVVKEQELPDGNFPTVSYPNPEDKHAFDLALKLADEVKADLVLATDPDADRLGVYAKDAKTGNYQSFTGNMSGMLILDYVLSQRKALGLLPENGAVVTTIVSGKMAKKITKEYHVELLETLTGFKYIGEQIKLFEQEHSYEYLFGYEESYGCLPGTYARDKDAVAAAMALCEVAAWCSSRNMTLCDQMEYLYQRYGYFKESLSTVTVKEQQGKQQIAAMMEEIRSNVPTQIGGLKVMQFRDYREDKLTNCLTGEVSATGLPRSNVLYFELEEDAWCCIRPSGTEPKVKCYAGVKCGSEKEADDKLKFLMEQLCNAYIFLYKN